MQKETMSKNMRKVNVKLNEFRINNTNVALKQLTKKPQSGICYDKTRNKRYVKITLKKSIT